MEYQENLEYLVNDVRQEHGCAVPQHIKRLWQNTINKIVHQRYKPLLVLNSDKTVYLVDGASVAGNPAKCAVVKYLQRSKKGKRELHYTQKYAGCVGPELYSVEELAPCIEVVMEAGEASLQEFLPIKKTEKQLKVARTIAELAIILEQNGEGHYDLKPKNVLVLKSNNPNESYRHKLIDFGLTRTQKEYLDYIKTGRIIGTPGYITPEVIRQDTSSYSHSVPDIYAYGILLYEILRGDLPRSFNLLNWNSYLALMRSNVYQNALFQLPLNSEPVFQELIRACTEPNPSMRPHSFREILKRLDNVS